MSKKDIKNGFNIFKSEKYNEQKIQKDSNTFRTILGKKNYESPEMLADKDALKSYLEAKKFLSDHKITISTITLNCKLNTLVDIDKFAKEVILKKDEIVSIKFGNRKDPATNRTIVFLKNKKKQSTKNFFNQVTILMKPINNPIRNYLNIKVFKNGSLQITGCKDMDDFNNVTSTLIRILREGKTIVTKKETKKLIQYVESPDKIGIFDIKVRMINSNLKLEYKIDRKQLAHIIKHKHKRGTKDIEFGYIECIYKPNGGHSCVNIKYKYDEISKPSIFVFQTGAIIITGAKNLTQIISSYEYIMRILTKYKKQIQIIDLDPEEVKKELFNFFRQKEEK
uniref:TATA-box binding protein n=1 Tax=viral metagenome TaxID=1070528 RepID=A0A6C0LT41_9ZZZZ